MFAIFVTMRKTMRCLLLGLFLSCITLACSDKKENASTLSPIPVRAVKVKTESRPLVIHASGTVASQENIHLSFKISGIIDKIAVDEGDIVKQGTFLATLNQTEMRARVNRAQSAFDKAQYDLANDEKLHRENVITKDRLLNSKNILETAQSNLEIAKHNLEFASILAPVDGRILKKTGEPSEMIEAGRPLFLLSASSPHFVFRTSVTDRDVVRIAQGDSATVFLDAYPNQQMPAILSKLPASSDAKTGLYQTELSLQTDAISLLQGMHGRAQIYSQHNDTGPLISMDALQNIDQNHGEIYILDGTNARKRNITFGSVYNHTAIVQDGLTDGEIVIIQGSAYLRDNSLVKVISPAQHQN